MIGVPRQIRPLDIRSFDKIDERKPNGFLEQKLQFFCRNDDDILSAHRSLLS